MRIPAMFGHPRSPERSRSNGRLRENMTTSNQRERKEMEGKERGFVLRAAMQMKAALQQC